jgi:hypothetical protein
MDREFRAYIVEAIVECATAPLLACLPECGPRRARIRTAAASTGFASDRNSLGTGICIWVVAVFLGHAVCTSAKVAHLVEREFPLPDHGEYLIGKSLFAEETAFMLRTCRILIL